VAALDLVEAPDGKLVMRDPLADGKDSSRPHIRRKNAAGEPLPLAPPVSRDSDDSDSDPEGEEKERKQAAGAVAGPAGARDRAGLSADAPAGGKKKRSGGSALLAGVDDEENKSKRKSRSAHTESEQQDRVHMP